jgi:hypothetical protein
MLIGLIIACGMLDTAASAFGQGALDQYLPSGGSSTSGHQSQPKHQSSTPSPSPSASTSAPTTTTSTSAPKKHKAKPHKEAPAPQPVAQVSNQAAHDGGYPISSYVLLVIGLFVLGLAVRYLPPFIRRLRFRTVY